MGDQDQKYPEVNNTNVLSDQGFFRYSKKMNAKGNRKYGRFRVVPGRRIRGNQFSAGREFRAD